MGDPAETTQNSLVEKRVIPLEEKLHWAQELKVAAFNRFARAESPQKKENIAVLGQLDAFLYLKTQDAVAVLFAPYLVDQFTHSSMTEGMTQEQIMNDLLVPESVGIDSVQLETQRQHPDWNTDQVSSYIQSEQGKQNISQRLQQVRLMARSSVVGNAQASSQPK